MRTSDVRRPTSDVVGMIAVVLAVMLALAGCPRAQPVKQQAAGLDATAMAVEVARAHGQTQALTADVIILVKPPKQDTTTFKLNVWCAADGRTRILASKFDVDFCSALIAADGTLAAFLPRARVMVHADPKAPVDGARPPPVWLADLHLLSAELSDGPMPMRGPYITGAKADVFTCPSGPDLVAELEIDPETWFVRTKRLLRTDGALAATCTYDRYRAFDECHRATRMRLAIPDDATETTFVLKQLSALPMITEETMRFTMPDGMREVPMQEFLDRMGE
ncbi:MAG: hypothetical protein H0W83_09030 [Planctomycetes bacterium]|nr:hypothetical protein [Planctomycetota bacterium]